MFNICLVTIFKSFDNELEITLDSIIKQILPPSRLILVGHANTNEEKKIKEILNFKDKNIIEIEMILNKDKSLFNAMNLAIDSICLNSKEKHFLFLNSGDILFDEFTILNLNFLSKKYINKSIATQCILTKDNLKFIRPGKFNKKIINWPHQGFLASILNIKKNKIYLNEKNIISADRNWMYNLTRSRNVIYSPIVSSIHNLNGVSSVISFKGLIRHYLNYDLFYFIRYIVKYILSFIFTTNILITLIYKIRGYVKLK